MSNDSGKKDYPSRTFRIPPELLERFDAYVKKTGISKTFIIEKALEQYLDENEPQDSGKA